MATTTRKRRRATAPSSCWHSQFTACGKKVRELDLIPPAGQREYRTASQILWGPADWLTFSVIGFDYGGDAPAIVPLTPIQELELHCFHYLVEHILKENAIFYWPVKAL